MWRARHPGNGPQFSTQDIRIVSLDGGDPADAEAKRDQDGLGQRDCSHQSRNIVAWPRPQQHAHGRCPVGEQGCDGLEPDLRDLVEANRQHVRGQPSAEAGLDLAAFDGQLATEDLYGGRIAGVQREAAAAQKNVTPSPVRPVASIAEIDPCSESCQSGKCFKRTADAPPLPEPRRPRDD